MRALTAAILSLLVAALVWLWSVDQSLSYVAGQLSRLERRQESVDATLFEQKNLLLAQSESLDLLLMQTSRSRNKTENAAKAGPDDDQNETIPEHDLAAELRALNEKIDSLTEKMQSAQATATTTSGAGFAPRTQAGSNPGALHWSADQVLGEPDTTSAGDHPSAWAPRKSNGGVQWIEVGFDENMLATGAVIDETYNPGAVVKIEAIAANGVAEIVWEGEDPTTGGMGEFEIEFDRNLYAEGFKVYLDTNEVNGWNELDAIGLLAGNDV